MPDDNASDQITRLDEYFDSAHVAEFRKFATV